MKERVRLLSGRPILVERGLEAKKLAASHLLCMAMGKLTPAQENRLRAELRALTKTCPFDQRNPEDCPWFAVRRLRASARSAWLDALDKTDLSYFATCQQVCLTIKLKP